MGDDSEVCILPLLLGEDGSMSWGVVMVKLRHGAYPILSSEPVGMPHDQLPLPQQYREWFDVDPDGRVLNSCNSFRSCATCGSPHVFVIVS
jgi:hypothetical protein